MRYKDWLSEWLNLHKILNEFHLLHIRNYLTNIRLSYIDMNLIFNK